VQQSVKSVGYALFAGTLVFAASCGSDKKQPSASSAGASGNAGASTGGSSTSNGGSSAAGASTGGSNVGAGGAYMGKPLTTTAKDLAMALRGKTNFLIGLGNDLPKDYNWDNSGAFTLGVTLDLHYIYLTGLPGEGGWTDWNPGAQFPVVIGNADKKHNVSPMQTVWSMPARGENRMDVLVDDSFMSKYWDAAKQLFQRLGTDLNVPGVVHLEPDFWAYAEMATKENAKAQPVHLSPECTGLPADLTGMGRCWLKLARTYAPKVLVGFHASTWGGPTPEAVGNFLKSIGGSEADLVIIDMLDRDAGCFEDGKLPQCMRQGKFYWDETNATSPNFHEHLAWSKALSTTLGRPILWWQLPLGVPSTTPGGTSGHFRDNRVKYLFSHVQEFVDAGGLGAVFGTGADDQTFITTDGGQFKNAVTQYFQAPVALP